MNNRFAWIFAPAVLGAFLFFAQHAAAQQGGPDVGQQGEFNGEHVDTGAAALDSGPEAAESGEASESLNASPAVLRATVKSAVVAPTATGKNSVSEQDMDVEGDFDLQEIGGQQIGGQEIGAQEMPEVN